MAILGALLGANQKAAAYSIQGKQAYNEGLKQKIAKYSQANAAERQAASVLSTAGRNMMTARRNQTAAQGEARTVQAASGFQQDTGSGGRLEKQVTEATDKQIANMATAASNQAGTLYGQAMTAKNAGDSALRLGERTQQIYSKMAKASKTAGWIEAGIDATIAVIQGVMGYNNAQSYNEGAAEYNQQNGYQEGDAGYREQVNPYREAFYSGMSNTNGSLLPILKQYDYLGSYGKRRYSNSYSSPYNDAYSEYNHW